MAGEGGGEQAATSVPLDAAEHSPAAAAPAMRANSESSAKSEDTNGSSSPRSEELVKESEPRNPDLERKSSPGGRHSSSPKTPRKHGTKGHRRKKGEGAASSTPPRDNRKSPATASSPGPPVAYYTVTKELVPVRSSPSIDATVLIDRRQGDVVAVTFRNGPWGKLHGSASGWVLIDGDMMGIPGGKQLRSATEEDMFRAMSAVRIKKERGIFDYYDMDHDGNLEEGELMCALIEAETSAMDLDGDIVETLFAEFSNENLLSFDGFQKCLVKVRSPSQAAAASETAESSVTSGPVSAPAGSTPIDRLMRAFGLGTCSQAQKADGEWFGWS